jgi:pimeloyl-ACP methyl ester carboxylesterase
MKIKIFIASLLIMTGCQKKYPELPGLISDTFYVINGGSSMRVLVEGNIESKVVILFVHGGPGEGSVIYNTDYISENIEDKYAIAYWDQRSSGASQGNRNENDLTLDQIIEDLRKVVLVIKSRYGQDTEVFILSHSFGGLVTAGFLTTRDNQNLVRGYIDTDGSHNYPKNDSLTREMLLRTGTEEIAINNHINEWNKIISYCNAHTGNFTFAESRYLEKYAAKAENYMADVTKVNYFTAVAGKLIRDHAPLTSMLVNLWSTQGSGLLESISTREYSSSLRVITIPVLLLYGKYDFICPPELGNDFYSKISSVDKKMVVSAVSGHNMMFQDRKLFSDEVTRFIETHR